MLNINTVDDNNSNTEYFPFYFQQRSFFPPLNK